MAENDELEDFDSFTKGVKTGGKSLADFNKMVRKIIMAEGEQYLKTNKMNRALADALRYQHKMTLAQKSADLVTEHLKMRDAMQKSVDSLSLFTGYLSSPVSPMFVFKKVSKHIGDTISSFDRLKQVTVDLAEAKKEFNADTGNIQKRDAVTKLEKEQSELQKSGAEHEGNKGLMDKLSGAKEFFLKHKTGILIGGASAGILLAVLKRAFDVSPMFQAIKKLLNFGFMLILRPIGDFFGFIMRPVMIMLLRRFIIPWYRDVYPKLKDAAKFIGDPLAATGEAIHDTLSDFFGGGSTGDAAASTTMVAGGAGTLVGGAKLALKSEKLVTKVLQPLTQTALKITSKIPVIGNTMASVAQKLLPKVLTTTATKVATAVVPKLVVGLSSLADATPSVAKTIKPVQQATSIMVKVGKQVKNAAAVAQASVKLGGKALLGLGQSLGTKGVVSLGARLATRAIPLVGWGLAAADIALSPETLGGLIPTDSDWRLDKLMNTAFGTALSEDAAGNFKTSGLGQFVGMNEGMTSKMIDMVMGTGAGTGVTGGGQGAARSGKSKNININILGDINNNADIDHMGQVVENHIQETNTQTSDV